MKIAAISDLHGQLPVVPECDLLLIAGDICPVWNHTLIYQKSWLDTNFRRWLHKVNETVDQVVGVAGNHDWFFQEDHYGVYGLKLPWKYLRDDEFEYRGLKIYGTPWQPTFKDWAFNLDEPDLKEKWDLIPEDTDLLVLHGPPHKFGDLTDRGEHVGSPSLADRIFQVNPKLAVFGHVHGGYGEWKEGDVTLANVSLLNESYQMTNPIFLFDLPTE